MHFPLENGNGYASRQNVSECDYYSRVKDTAGIIHVTQWRKWRMTGIAFEFGEATYEMQNRTMITSIKGRFKSGPDRGMNKDVKGYWLDILNSPYVSHGVEVTSNQTFAQGLFEVLNKGTGAEQYRHHTVEVSMLNLIDFMWQFEVR
jgi:dynein assembly factor 3